MPEHRPLQRSDFHNRNDAEEADRTALEAAISELGQSAEFIVIDCPGTDSFIGRLAVSHADRLITPINDSFIDFDLLGTVDPTTVTVTAPSIYAATVWEQRKIRALRDRRSIDWIVMRNRLSSINARNKAEMSQVLQQLAKRVGFRLASGFSERVIYRELFLRGMTMLDMFEIGNQGKSSLSHIAARQEVRDLLNTMQLP